MTILVTGATGHLGRLVVQELLARGVGADQIVATGRRVDTLADLASTGVVVRRADFDDPSTLAGAFAGVDTLLLVSASEPGRRLPQHTNAVTAATAAGVGRIVYTSILHADTTAIGLAAEHKATEALLRASGLPFTFLRNGWYLENYTPQIPTYLRVGGVVGSAGEGRISAAARADYAAAAAAVLTQPGHENAVYELAGDESFTLAELAATVATATGQDLAYTDVPAPALVDILRGAGLPQPVAQMLTDVDVQIRAGALQDDSRTLSRLAGRPTTSLKEAVVASLA